MDFYSSSRKHGREVDHTEKAGCTIEHHDRGSCGAEGAYTSKGKMTTLELGKYEELERDLAENRKTPCTLGLGDFLLYIAMIRLVLQEEYNTSHSQTLSLTHA